MKVGPMHAIHEQVILCVLAYDVYLARCVFPLFEFIL